MPKIIYVSTAGDTHTLDIPTGTRVMQAAIAAGIEEIVGECGGQAMCATCHVYVDEPWAGKLPPLSAEEDAMLTETVSPRTDASRLSCQLIVNEDVDGLVVRLPTAQV
ncbi:2Fe-2S iron-sulfur cluster-binding protein [Mycolicibacterium helvum]|uniref:Ferredoxin n=1 Tax=Mycolicibacterium helvum TaxID=1534349 RepID=A0A7I7T1F6_9MYCO|nr:2Fe-2S iron-sulfur cluster-binding protein [Mycolicibacterium helvum]BBY61906.1 ferredoxin [Mycolicibacterium helvum]